MATNRRIALYRESIENALRQHRTLALRSEQHQHFHDLFADNKQLHLLRAPDWQVIFGRRGTGKTFLLGMLHEEVMGDLQTDRILSAMFTAQDFIASPVGREIDDKERALGYFQQFIELLAQRIVAIVDNVLGEATLLETLTGSRRRAVDQIQTLAIEILDLSRVGNPVAAWCDIKKQQTRKKSKTKGASGKAVVQASLSAKGPALAFSAHSDAQATLTSDELHVSEVDEAIVPRFASIRERLMELLKTLQVSRLNILIDEWSTLDPTAAQSIQAQFAELLKRTFGGTAMISVKIATNRYQTRFDNRGGGTAYTGLEMGADIFEATDLDNALRDTQELTRFCTQLLYRRLLYCESGLEVFDPRREGIPDEQFLLSIFRDTRAFAELVKGAEGNPRAFLQVFNNLAAGYKWSVRNLWCPARVQECVHTISVEERQPTLEFHSEANQLLLTSVMPVVTATGSRLFVIKRTNRAAFANAFDELLEKRLVHEYPRAQLPAKVRTHFEAFLVSYGIWLDWQRPFDRKELAVEKCFDTAKGFKGSLLERLTIDVSLVNRSHITCARCHAQFPQNARSFVVRGLCPECFEPAEESAKVSGF
ncbi:MAG: ATP-binding protein [Gammaproteobacteria bacterium]|nr:ATP-binding protein [Gammaproteobacteria bacterium]